jgi:hypothetical protein
MEAELSLRVVRGWQWQPTRVDEDGGNGFVGTIVGVESQGPVTLVTVFWDIGNKCTYSMTEECNNILRVFDNAPVGKHIYSISFFFRIRLYY